MTDTRYYCPICGHNNENCYRCDECGRDLTAFDNLEVQVDG